MEEQQLLRDPEIEPTSEVIAECLGAVNNDYVKFIDTLKSHDVEVDWRYYNDGKSWLGKSLYKWTTSRGTNKEMTVFWLSIWDGFFKVTLFIPEKVREQAMSLPLGKKVKKMIGEAKQMGKLTFFPVVFELRSDEFFEAIYTLVDFKKTIK
jgi:hypothetical protein